MRSASILPVILCGGSGTRLWPLSTDAAPKQFHALAGEDSLFVDTATRLAGAEGLDALPTVVIAGDRHGAQAAEQLALAGLNVGAIILEPSARHTGAAAAVAALHAAESGNDPIVLLMPADHVIVDRAAFVEAIRRAVPFADSHILTFGITPDRPETGYGYILHGHALADGVLAIRRFVEKPRREAAEELLAAGGCSWNAGIFMFRPSVLLAEMEAHAPEILVAAQQALAGAGRSGKDIRLDADAFGRAPSVPLDIAVMEKTAIGAVAPCDIGWADIGSWSELWRLGHKDGQGNVVSGSVLARDASDNLVRAEGIHVSIAGVSGLVVVATRDAVLILPKEQAQSVRDLIPSAQVDSAKPSSS